MRDAILHRPRDRRGGDPSARTLILCSHGTRSPQGQRAVARLADAVAARLAGVEVRPAFVDVQEPHVDTAVAALGPFHGSPAAAGAGAGTEYDTVLVPALLSTGYHVKTDLARAAGLRPGIRVAPPLGPDARLTGLLVRRLAAAAGGRPSLGDAVILAGAGSSDPEAARALAVAAADLADRIGHPVSPGNAAGGQPRVTDLVALARERGATRVIVVSYLLAPGFFADRLAGCGASAVTDPLLSPDRTPAELIDLVLERAGMVPTPDARAPVGQVPDRGDRMGAHRIEPPQVSQIIRSNSGFSN